jgi:membrane protein DedA with SNARE-associated domain
MDRDERLQRSHPAKAEHGAFLSSKRLMRILRSVVQTAAGLLAVNSPDVAKSGTIRAQ